MSDSKHRDNSMHWLMSPLRQPWRAFDEQARDDFLNCIREGVMSREKAAALCGVHLSTVKAWIARGRKTDYADEDYEYRLFYLHLCQAEAERASVAETTILRAARTDWRAADVLARRQESRELATERKRIARAEADIKEQQARFARIQADLAERKLKTIAGRFVFPPEAWDAATEEERSTLEGLFTRRGLVRVSPEEVQEEMEVARDPAEDSELQALAERWGLKPPPEEPDSGPDSES